MDGGLSVGITQGPRVLAMDGGLSVGFTQGPLALVPHYVRTPEDNQFNTRKGLFCPVSAPLLWAHSSHSASRQVCVAEEACFLRDSQDTKKGN